MQFIEFLTMCETIVNDIMSGVFGNGSLWNILNSNLGDEINSFLQIFYDAPLIGSLLQSTVGSLITATVGDLSLLYFMIGFGIPTVLIYSFVKWLVGIVTGS